MFVVLTNILQLTIPTIVVSTSGIVYILVVAFVKFINDNLSFFVGSIVFIYVVVLSSKFLFVNVCKSNVPTKLHKIP